MIKTSHHPKDVNKVERQIRVFVRDTTNKLPATNDRLHAEQAEDPIDAEVCDIQSKCLPQFRLYDSTTSTQSVSSGPISVGLSVLQKADHDPQYSTNRGDESRAPVLALLLVGQRLRRRDWEGSLSFAERAITNQSAPVTTCGGPHPI